MIASQYRRAPTMQWLTAANIGPAARTRLTYTVCGTLLIATTVIAILCVVGRKWPHADVLIVSFLLTGSHRRSQQSVLAAGAITGQSLQQWPGNQRPFDRHGAGMASVLLAHAAPGACVLDW